MLLCCFDLACFFLSSFSSLIKDMYVLLIASVLHMLPHIFYQFPLMQNGKTALDFAINNGHTEVVNILRSVSPKPEVEVRKNKHRS